MRFFSTGHPRPVEKVPDINSRWGSLRSPQPIALPAALLLNADLRVLLDAEAIARGVG
jgi:hypothetical protein